MSAAMSTWRHWGLLGVAVLAVVAGAAGCGSSGSSSPAAGSARADQASAAPAATDVAASRAALTVRATRFGRILFAPNGRAIYAFTRDPRGGKSRCYGACAAAWPVAYAKPGRPIAGSGAQQRLLGVTVRRDGRRQLTYAGRPLYFYVGDTSPGEVSCQNVVEFGGTWLVVRPDGRLVR